MGHNPVVTGIKGILEEWSEFRRECIRRGLTFDIERIKEKLHLLYGLAKILLDIDKAIKIIRETEAERDVVPNLMEGFGIDKIQAEYVAEIKLRNLNREYILKRTDETEELEQKLEEYEDILSSKTKINSIICKQLKEVAKKYGEDRKTEIITDEEVEEYSEEKYIEDYAVKLFLSEQGYFKKISIAALRTSGEQKVKDDDKIKTVIETNNKADLLFFSDKQNVYKTHVYDMPDGKASLLGDYLPNLLGTEADEKIISMIVTSDYQGHVLFAFENGKMAKIPLSAYETKTNRKRLQNAYSDASKLVDMRYFTEDIELAAFSSNGKVLVFDTSMVSEKATRSSQGVSVLLSKKGSRLIELRDVSDLAFADPKYYRTKNIPAVGCFIRKGDAVEEQISFI